MDDAGGHEKAISLTDPLSPTVSQVRKDPARGPLPTRHSDSLRQAATAAARLSLDVEWLDPHSGYLLTVADRHRRLVLAGGAACPYPVNTATAVSLARDKGHTATLLRAAGLPTPEGAVFFTDDRWRDLRGPGREVADAIAYAERIGWPVFVKPNDGSRGAFAGLATTPADLARRFEAMAGRHPVALVQRPILAPEWRVVVFDGAVEWAYRRGDALLHGDGIKTVAALLAEANAALGRRGLDPVPPDDAYLAERLASLGADVETILPAGEAVCFTPRRNVAGGGGVADMPGAVPPDLADMAVAATQTLGLRLAGVDLLLPEGEGPLVLEVNGNPSLAAIESVGEGERVIALWGRLLTACFADPRLSQPIAANRGPRSG